MHIIISIIVTYYSNNIIINRLRFGILLILRLSVNYTYLLT